MFKDYPDVVTIKMLCQMLNIGKNSAYHLIKKNEIESLYIGRSLRIPKYEVIRFVKKQNKKI